MSGVVWQDDGRRLVLGALIKSGGAGGVYPVADRPDEVAKIYHPGEDRSLYERKVAAMLDLSPNLPDLVEDGRRYVQIAWPLALLRDDKRRFVGFTMPMIDVQATSELECVLQEKQARALGLPTGLGAKVTLAANLAAVIAELHRQGHHVIDLKPVNLRFYPRSLYMAMLDCDGFGVQGRGEHFVAEQITPDYLAPEFHGGRIPAEGEEAQDCFALAVVVFQLLNFGVHPFTGRPASERVPTDVPSRIARRCYAYGYRPHAELAPSPVSGHLHMPSELRLLFDRAFEGAGTRPSARAWADLLKHYAQRSSHGLSICANDATHQHFAGLPCAACARTALIQATAKGMQSARPARPGLPPRAPASASSRATVPPPSARANRPAPANRPPPAPAPAKRPAAPPVFPAAPAFPSPPSVPTPAGPSIWFQLRLALYVFAFFFVTTYWLTRPAPSEADTLTAPTAAYSPAEPSGQSDVEPFPMARQLGAPPPPLLAATASDIRVAMESMTAGDRVQAGAALFRLRGAADRMPPGSGTLDPQDDAAFQRLLADPASGHPHELELSLRASLGAFDNRSNAETAYEVGCLRLLDHDAAGARAWFRVAVRANPDIARYWRGVGIAAEDDSEARGALGIAELVNFSGIDAGSPTAGFPDAFLLAAGVDRAALRTRAEAALSHANAIRGQR